jgi:MFS family permease
LRLILVRAGMFMFCANCIWALLPLVARDYLHLGSGGYGLLLGGVGVGAVAGAAVLPRLRFRLAPNALLAIATIVLACATVALAFARAVAPDAAVVVVAGVVWILALSTLNSQYQATLPGWMKARGMSYYLMVFQGGGALGSAAFGIVAQRAGLQDALLVAAGLLAAGAAVGWLYPFKQISPDELLPAGDWPAPQHSTTDSPAGPVLVTVVYHAAPGRAGDMLDALRAGRYARRRTGAVSWQAWRDAADQSRICEQFVVGTWEEHERQHERVSRRDQQRLDEIDAMSDPAHPPKVSHWLSA